MISVISPSEEPPVVNIRVEFQFEEGKGPTSKLWVSGRPLEDDEWAVAKTAIESVVSVYEDNVLGRRPVV